MLLAFFGLALRLGWQMIIRGDEYAVKAVKQQTSDSVVSAVRGSIVDRNGNDLAISATANTIWIRPERVRTIGKTEAEHYMNKEEAIKKLAAILELDEETVRSYVESDSKLLRLKKYVDSDTAALVRAADIYGLEITEDAKRYYPNHNFLSQVLGSTNDDNVGISGLELQYNSVLSGIDGRRITNKDNQKNTLAYGVDKYYAAQDGVSLQLTIDQTIQMIITQRIQEAKELCKANRVMCLMMDPKTGEILGMAQTDDFDPNYPREPLAGDEEKFAQMSAAEQYEYWNKNWRCFCVQDVYEPGSTFKLITTSIALEEGVATPNSTFYCQPVTVADYTLKCWYYPRSHGKENLYQAVENSCNPAMISLANSLGINKYYEGLDNFGLTDKTGIDFPGETYNILQKKSVAGPVGLATMSYGQGIAVSPLSLVSAVSSLANEGYLMQPRLVKALIDSDGKVVEKYDPVVKSRTVSKQTADEVLAIMEKVVSEGGGGRAKVSGFKVGGKTGTASKPVAGGYSDTDVYASFLGVAPVDDPRFVILVIVDTPRTDVLYGSVTAAPCAQKIMEEVLTYMGVEPQYSDAELRRIKSNKVTVPDITNMDVEQAYGVLGGYELEGELAPAIENSSRLVIVDQFPRAGTEVNKGSKVTLYYEIHDASTETAEAVTD
ncbi:MAG: PASTA domain-containing protein [Firmicutes bacterium]|nr:PASTA domain-containing protein [Bacillota bacterium]